MSQMGLLPGVQQQRHLVVVNVLPPPADSSSGPAVFLAGREREQPEVPPVQP